MTDHVAIKRTGASHPILGSVCYCPDCHEWFYDVYLHIAWSHDYVPDNPLEWDDGEEIRVL